MDEQAQTEPLHPTMRDAVRATRQTVVTEPVHEALHTQRMEPVEGYEALRPMEGVHPAQATARLVETDALRPMEQAHLTQTEALRPTQAHLAQTEALRPMEQAHLTQTEALRPTQAHLTRTEALRPMESTARLAEADALRPTQAHLAQAEALRPMERSSRTAADGVGSGEPGPVLATTRAAAATPPDGGEATAKRRASTAEQGSQGSGGSAGTGFRVDPAQYQAAVSPVLAAADQLSQLVTGLTAFLDHTQSTAPWGHDESGKKFAEGEKGYLKYSTETLKGLKGMPDAVRYIAEGLKAMAQNYQSAEDGTTDVFRSDGGGEVAAAPQVGTYTGAVNPTMPTGALGNIAQGRPTTHTGRA
ncbi:WXG100 family type VII secretion target [Kitasatospora sp. NPDC088346]|uniref:WXG100 family type VII secretion target n=1 Tax=Kitasatospora sp. NPDC088346 TaxID=3364073 RepID=UPI00380BB1AD